MKKYYIFFRKSLPLEPCRDIAHYIHDVQCANAGAGLGYDTVMVYCGEDSPPFHFLKYFFPFRLEKADKRFRDFYGASDKLDFVKLVFPLFTRRSKPLHEPAMLIKYYIPFHIAPRAFLIHTQDFLMVEAAVRAKVPVIYEQHYLANSAFKEDVVNSPFFKLAVVQSGVTKQSLIEHGMPQNKVAVMHNGCEPGFLIRQKEQADAWRRELLSGGQDYLAVYSGSLFPFKGIGIIIGCAKQMPQIKFVLTGGTLEQIEGYRKIAQDIGNISFLGWIEPRSRLEGLFQAADIMLHPHMYRYGDHTDPVKFFQYLASGTPIAATDLPFLEEFKNKNLALEICKPGSLDEFIPCIRSVLKKYPRKQEGYAENIELAKHFTWEKRMERILELAGLGKKV